MQALAILMVVGAVGIDAGWVPLDEGGYEYTLQIEPETLAELGPGAEIVGKVPLHVDVRRYRVLINRGKLSRIDAPRPAPVEFPLADVPPERQLEPRQKEAANRADFSTSKPAQRLEDVEPDRGERWRDHRAEKPSLDARSSAPAEESERPWLPLLVAIVLLAGSLGANAFLGWIAWEARGRYRELMTTHRRASA